MSEKVNRNDHTHFENPSLEEAGQPHNLDLKSDDNGENRVGNGTSNEHSSFGKVLSPSEVRPKNLEKAASPLDHSLNETEVKNVTEPKPFMEEVDEQTDDLDTFLPTK